MRNYFNFCAFGFLIWISFYCVELKADSKKILFIRKDSQAFTSVYQSMSKDLKQHFQIVDYILKNNTPYLEFKKKLTEEKPALLVLMDNQAVSQAMRYNQDHESNIKPIFGVSIMALNLKTILKDNKFLAGIAFEAPAYTLVTSYRSLFKKKVNNVIVYYRKSQFADEILASKAQLATENIQLEAIDAEQYGKEPTNIEQFIRSQLPKRASESHETEVFWTMLDSSLLTPVLFQEVWSPVSRDSKAPFLIGVEELVKPEAQFATYGTTPNLIDLGNQAVQMIENIITHNIDPSTIGVENLISVDKVLNRKKAPLYQLNFLEESTTEMKIL